MAQLAVRRKHSVVCRLCGSMHEEGAMAALASFSAPLNPSTDDELGCSIEYGIEAPVELGNALEEEKRRARRARVLKHRATVIQLRSQRLQHVLALSLQWRRRKLWQGTRTAAVLQSARDECTEAVESSQERIDDRGRDGGRTGRCDHHGWHDPAGSTPLTAGVVSRLRNLKGQMPCFYRI
eukprot:3920917-Prymnesium_polylepis.1